MSDEASSSALHRWSGLGRAVDPSVPTNRTIAALTLVALLLGAGWALYDGAALWRVAWAGVNAALTVFISWALTRELAPDDDPAAFVAVALAAAAWVAWGEQAILLPAATMLAVRLVNRSTGMAAEPLDSGFVVVGFGALAWLGSWSYGLLGGLALALDGALPPVGSRDARRRHLALAAVPLAAALARGLAESASLRGLPWPVLALAGAGLAAAALHPRPVSVGDVDGVPLHPWRVRAGTALGVASLALAAAAGAADARALGLGWASVTAATAYSAWRSWTGSTRDAGRAGR